MKRIDAFIQPHKLSKVIGALHALPSFPGLTVFDAHGQGHGRGVGGHFAYDLSEGLLLHKRSYIVIVCEDTEAAEIANSIALAAHAGKKGDGLIVISDVVQMIRIRDFEAST